MQSLLNGKNYKTDPESKITFEVISSKLIYQNHFFLDLLVIIINNVTTSYVNDKTLFKIHFL